jgi:hypothetical protein
MAILWTVLFGLDWRRSAIVFLTSFWVVCIHVNVGPPLDYFLVSPVQRSFVIQQPKHLPFRIPP